MANNRHILFISPEYVKTKTPILNDVNEKYIVSNILNAQDFYIQRLLGSDFYDKIVEQIEDFETAYEAGTTGITWEDYVDTDYHSLIKDYIRPTLLYFTKYESYYSLYSKITNKGIVTQTSDNSATISETMLEKMRSDALNKAEFYSENLKNYLLDNTDLTNEFQNNDIEDIQQDTSIQYKSGGWFLRGTGKYSGTAYERFHKI